MKQRAHKTTSMLWIVCTLLVAATLAAGCSDTDTSAAEELLDDVSDVSQDSATASNPDTATEGRDSRDGESPDSDAAVVEGDCPFTLGTGAVVYDLCTGNTVCCEAPLDGKFIGCVDTNSVEHCGACGNTCGDGEQCINDQCTCGQLTPQSADGLGAVCGEDEACCFNPNGVLSCRAEADCQCGGTPDPVTGDIEGGVACTGVQICCWVDLPGLPAVPEPTCVDPTKDVENCGACVLDAQDATPKNEFQCAPGLLCKRNFEYSLGRPPEEQHAEGIYIGECRLECFSTHTQCPGGVDETGAPYTQDQQSCINPLSSVEFCGALPRRDDASTSGQCSVQHPTTFGELRNFQGVRCGAGQTCRAKLECTNPDPFPGTDDTGQPCDPRTHYYYDVAKGSDTDFPPSGPLPAGAVFNPTSPADQDAYIENIYLRAVCDTTCSNTMLRCVSASGAPTCIDPLAGFSEFCGAVLGSDCSGDVDASGVPGPLGGDNNGINCNQLPNVAGATCAGGGCTNLSCDPGFGDCDGDPSTGCETDLTTDSLHCGQCNAACTDGLAGVASATCAGGQCNVTCDPGRANCQNAVACSLTPGPTGCSVDVLVGGTGRDGCETDTNADKLNCGACGNACESASNVALANCAASTCDIVTCATDRADCDGNPANGCETFAGQQDFCNASNTCQGPATPGTTIISGDRARPNNANEYIHCSNPATFGSDPATSWACVRNIADTAYECQCSSCPIGFSSCSYPCLCEPLNTTSNCTACGNVCGTGAICTGSTAIDDCKCTVGGETCRQTGTNYNGASCSGTSCVLACSAGFADCDGLSTNGCETNINTDPINCGGCNAIAPNPGAGLICGTGARCNAGAGPGGRQCQCGTSGELCLSTGASYSAASCVINNCVLSCNGSLRDCNSSVGDGCEVDISVPNETHCGGCSTDINGVPIAPPGTGSANNCNNVPTTTTSANTTCINNLGLRCSYCGDNRYDGNLNSARTEQCDDGNTINGDGCSSTCQEETGYTCMPILGSPTSCSDSMCGNGIVNPGESCDPAPAGSLPTATCDIDCTVRVCGDGVRNAVAGEVCDDNNTFNGDCCSSTCLVEAGCSCSGPENGLSSCFGNACGNGVLGGPEQCDPAPAGSLPTATCDIDCTVRVCGDGRRNPASSEMCDDGNTINGDGCSSTCLVETGFSCSGPANGLTICTSPSCGNGVLNAGEACDAATLPTATCDVDCTIRVCGDGIRNTALPEACDDGDTSSGDGCSSTCTLESGFTCTTPANALSTCN